MPLRLVEATIPADAIPDVATVLDDLPVIHVRVSELVGDLGLISALVDAEHAEVLSDRLASRYDHRDGFRLVFVPVAATVPAVAEAASPEDEETAEPPEPPVRVGFGRISREELHGDISSASRLTKSYLVMVVLSTLVAAVGLLRGDVAIIIGAMVIAPLLGPNVALALSASLGDGTMARGSLATIAAGVAVATVLSVGLGLTMEVDPAAAEIAGRTSPGVGDVVLALAAGTAGALAFTSGVPAVVVGVMVAVALLPPLVVAGLLAGGGHWRPAGGAVLLVLTNVTCVNLAAVSTFFLQQVRPRTWWEADRARKATRLAAIAWIVLLAGLVALILSGVVGGA